MEDLLSIVVLIIYFVAMGAARKNKKKKKAGQKTALSRDVQFEQAFERIAESVLSGERSVTEKRSSVKAKQKGMTHVQEGTDPCHEGMLAPQRPSMRLKIASQEEMHAAGEGEDPCHSGEAPDEGILLEDSPVYCSPIFHTEDQDAFAQDVLRGVIMSEVLMRPGQRRMSGGMKQGA